MLHWFVTVCLNPSCAVSIPDTVFGDTALAEPFCFLRSLDIYPTTASARATPTASGPPRHPMLPSLMRTFAGPAPSPFFLLLHSSRYYVFLQTEREEYGVAMIECQSLGLGVC